MAEHHADRAPFQKVQWLVVRPFFWLVVLFLDMRRA
jgi:hypothetical protein